MSFVVRSAHPGRDSKILLERTTNTDNAYNSFGGTTLYGGPEGPGDATAVFAFLVGECRGDGGERQDVCAALLDCDREQERAVDAAGEGDEPAWGFSQALAKPSELRTPVLRAADHEAGVGTGNRLAVENRKKG